MLDVFHRSTTALADSAHDHPWRTLLIALIAFAVALWGTSHLRINQDIKAFLPPDAQSVSRLEQLRERIGAQTDLLVAIESEDPKANIAYGTVLAQRLAKLDALRFVIFKRDISFFERKALLYLPVGELLDLRKKVITQIKREVAKHLVVNLDDDEGETSPKKDGETASKKETLSFDPKKRIAKVFGGAEKPSSYIQNADGTLLIIRARPIKQTTDVGFTKRLVKKVQQIIAETEPQKYHPTMKAHVRGEYAERVAESSSILGQVVVTAALAVLILFLMIATYFRSLRSIPIVLIPVIVSVFATFGVGALLYGSFNLATAFIFAILLGLGVDFSIHLLARYQFERRRRGHLTRSALRLSISSTGAAVAAGAATSIAVFWLLQLGRFRGFSQLGMMAGIGIILALFATFTMVPAIISLLERCVPSRVPPLSQNPSLGYHDEKGQRSSSDPAVSSTTLRGPTIPRRLKVLAGVILLASLGSAGMFLFHTSDVSFEYDFNKLGRKKKAHAHKRDGKDYRSATGQAVSYAPAVAMCQDPTQCARTTRLLIAINSLDKVELAHLRARRTSKASEVAATLGHPKPKTSTKVHAGSDDDDDDDNDDEDADPTEADDGPFASLRAELAGGKLLPEQRAILRPFTIDRLTYMKHYLRGFLSLQAFVPDRQADKLRIIADIKRHIDRKRATISEATGGKLDQWYTYLEVKTPITVGALPTWITTQFVETNGSKGRFVVIWNGGSKRDYRHTKHLYDVYFNLKIGPKKWVPLAANYFILAELIDTLKADGPLVLSAAGIAVFVSLLVLFRSLRGALLVAIPLVASISWLLGIFWLYGIKLNLFSVIVLPMLIGMAVDNGIHIYHRYLETRNIRIVLREVGSAMTLTTATTFVGFSSLLIADHVGIQTLGFAAALGMLLGLVGSLVTLPALLVILGPWGLPKRSEHS